MLGDFFSLTNIVLYNFCAAGELSADGFSALRMQPTD